MEAWQSQQRAQKQKDRQNKNQSAQMLQSYRGGIKEEDELLKKIRLEDQQKKKEAQDNLQNFRVNADNIETKSPTKATNKFDGPLPEMVAPPMKDDPAAAITAGAVSSIAANFTAVNVTKPATEAGAGQKKTEKTKTTPDATATVVESSSSGAAVKNQPSTPVAEKVDLAASNGSQSTNESSTQSSWVQVNSEEVPQEPTADATEPATTGAVSPAVTSPTGTSFTRLDVDFSFGLISTRSSPSFDGYMQGVADVVTSALEEHDGGTMKQFISYDPQNTPYVEKISKDGTW